MNLMEFVAERQAQLIQLTIEHIQIMFISILVACIIGIPLGILLATSERIKQVVMAVVNACQAIPSLAFLGFLIPLTGIGIKTTIILVVIYSILPIVKNTCIGILNIDRDIIETAKGIGLTKMQILTKVQLPIALPVIMGGVRIATVWAVGTVTLAAYAGGKGLGFMIYSGISMMNTNMILSGAIPACILAMLSDLLIGILEKWVTPEGVATDKNKNS
ncbi:MAG: ABC transporter permease [Eubacterium sp.]